MKKSVIAASIMASFALTSLTTQADTSYLWQETLDQAKGQTVYFNAWGGADNINDYIQWAADRIKEEYDVTLKQVKLTDTSDAVNRVLAEKINSPSFFYRDISRNVKILNLTGDFCTIAFAGVKMRDISQSTQAVDQCVPKIGGILADTGNYPGAGNYYTSFAHLNDNLPDCKSLMQKWATRGDPSRKRLFSGALIRLRSVFP